jgi:hypothetical protein
VSAAVQVSPLLVTHRRFSRVQVNVLRRNPGSTTQKLMTL